MPDAGTDYTPQIVGDINRATDRTRGTIADMYRSAGANERDRWDIFGNATAIPLHAMQGLSDAAVWRQNQRRGALAEEAQRQKNEAMDLDLEAKRDENAFMGEPQANDRPPAPGGQLPPWQPPSGGAAAGAPGQAPGPGGVSPSSPSAIPTQTPSLGMSATGEPVSRRRALLGAQYGNMMSEEGMGNWRRGQEQTLASEHSAQADVTRRAGEAGIRLTNAQIGQVGAGSGMTRQDRAENQGLADLSAFYENPQQNQAAIDATKAGLLKAGFSPQHVQGIEGRAMIAARDKKAASGQTNYLLTPSGQDAGGKVLDLKNRVGAITNAARNAQAFAAHVGYGEYMPSQMHPNAEMAMGEFKRAMAPLRPEAAGVGDVNVGLYGINTPSDKMRMLITDELGKAESELTQLKSLPLNQQSQQFQSDLAGLEAQIYAAKQAAGVGQGAAPGGPGGGHNALNLLAPQGAAAGRSNASMFAPRGMPNARPAEPAGGAPMQGGAPPPAAAPQQQAPAPPPMGAPPQAAMPQPTFRHLAQRKPIDAREMQTI